MNIFLRYILPYLFLVVVFFVTLLLPVDKRIQIIAPVITGVVMMGYKSFLGLPDVVIEDIGDTVIYSVEPTSKVKFRIHGIIINKSATGEGEIQELLLRIFINERTIDVFPCLYESAYIGFRFRPHGIFPDRTHQIEFESSSISQKEIQNLATSKGEILLKVVGQRINIYTVRLLQQ